MGLAGVGLPVFVACLAGLGFSAGLFIVPIAAVLQHRPAPEDKGAVQGVQVSAPFGKVELSVVGIASDLRLHPLDLQVPLPHLADELAAATTQGLSRSSQGCVDLAEIILCGIGGELALRDGSDGHGGAEWARCS